MTASTAMSREELIESAALDALGLLDEFEAAMYTRAFLNAPETVQQELRELQAEVAADPAFVSDETPDDALRERVLDAVNQAIEIEDEKLAPIASIGRRRALREGAADAEPRYRLLFAARFWRAACFALCGGLVVLSYFLAEQTRHSSDLGDLILSNATAEQINQVFGRSGIDILFEPDAKKIAFQPVNAQSDVRAVLLIDENGKSMLITEGLDSTEAQDYTLKMVDRRGNAHDIARFNSVGRIAGREVVAANHRMATSWEIHGPEGLVMTAVA